MLSLSGRDGLSAFYCDRISYTLSIVGSPSVGGVSPPGWALGLLAGVGATLAGMALKRSFEEDLPES